MFYLYIMKFYIHKLMFYLYGVTYLYADALSAYDY